PGRVTAQETIFVPLTGDDDPAVAYIIVQLTNHAPVPDGADGAARQDEQAIPGARHLRLYGFARLRGTLPADVQAAYDRDLRAFVACNAGKPSAVRVLGTPAATVAHFETSHDFGRVYDLQHAVDLCDDTTPSGDVLAALQVELELAP